MRALCLSDLHLDLAAARRLGATALAGGVELILSAGDLGVDGTNDRALYAALARGGVPVFSVPGNHDGDAAYDALVAELDFTDLHGKVVRHGGLTVAGFGLREWDGTAIDAHERGLEDFLARLDGVPAGELVLVTHLPPAGTLAAWDRRFVDHGSPALARYLAVRQPLASVCGHVHHREVVSERIGETAVVNAGPHGHVLALGPRSSDASVRALKEPQ